MQTKLQCCRFDAEARIDHSAGNAQCDGHMGVFRVIGSPAQAARCKPVLLKQMVHEHASA